MSVGAIKLITVWSNYYDPIKFATETRENEFCVVDSKYFRLTL
jgi:hypothetical protein